MTTDLDVYDSLLKEILDEEVIFSDEYLLKEGTPAQADDETAQLSPDLQVALESEDFAEKYIDQLKRSLNTPNKAVPISHPFQNGGGINARSSKHYKSRRDTKVSSHGNGENLTNSSDTMKNRGQHYLARLVNGVSSLVNIEQEFNTIRIPELDLPSTPETAIRGVLSKLYGLQEDLQIHLQGGPLTDESTLVVHRRKKIQELLDTIVSEIAVYEEFVNRSNTLSLDRILNEPDYSEEELLESETIETESDIFNNLDSRSDISKFSSTPTSSPSPKTFRSGFPELGRLRASSPTTSRNSRTSSPSLSEFDRSDFLDQSSATLQPWEAFLWTPLIKISSHLYSDSTRQEYGLPTVLAVRAIIAVGTTRGMILIYDYSQNLQCVLGSDAIALEHGAVTALSISPDQVHVAAGHARGLIQLWNISKPSTSARTIEPIDAPGVSTKDGHLKGTSILHLSFVGVRRQELISADDQGMSFYHVFYKILMVNAVETTRILGRYPSSTSVTTSPAKNKRPTTIFGLAALPLGQAPHATDQHHLMAILTPYKLVVVGLRPRPRTYFRQIRLKSKLGSHNDRTQGDANTSPSNALSGCLSWFPPTRRVKSSTNADIDPLLAFAWGCDLTILRASIPTDHTSNKRLSLLSNSSASKEDRIEFVKVGEWRSRLPIMALQWIDRQILLILTNDEHLLVFDPRTMQPMERCDLHTQQPIHHDRFGHALKELYATGLSSNDTSPSATEVGKPKDIEKAVMAPDMAYFHSIRTYRGKTFILGSQQLTVGMLLSWADRIIALVQSGDFLEAISLATQFYNGKSAHTVVGLPEDDSARRALVGPKLIELLQASLNYAFSNEHTFAIENDPLRAADTSEGAISLFAPSNSVLHQDLAMVCIEACLSMGEEDYLFGEILERYTDAHIQGTFLEALEPYLIADRIRQPPPGVIKEFVAHFRARRWLDRIERTIWHVDPAYLDIDQIVQLSHEEGLYDAMFYVWNRGLGDYVSPVIELLKVIKRALYFRRQQQRMLHSTPASEGDLTDLNDQSIQDREELEMERARNAAKLFDYFAHILTGRSYPDNTPIPQKEALAARATVYGFLFSGRCVVWPPVGGKLVLTTDDSSSQLETEDADAQEPTYPYLRQILRFDTASFLHSLEIAFNDPYLNGGDILVSGTVMGEEILGGKMVSRQVIINTLLEVMTVKTGRPGRGIPLGSAAPAVSRRMRWEDEEEEERFREQLRRSQSDYLMSDNEDSDNEGDETEEEEAELSTANVTQLYAFIARNLPKYTTFLLLSPTMLHRILTGLCTDMDPATRNLREEAVLSLLDVYMPADGDRMNILYEQAGFWRVLENVYRSEMQYGQLTMTLLKDQERRELVFESVRQMLLPSSSNNGNDPPLTERQRSEVVNTVMTNLEKFVEIDGEKTARLVHECLEGDHTTAIEILEAIPRSLFHYLRGLLEPESGSTATKPTDEDHAPVVEAMPENTHTVASSWPATIVTPPMHEQYIELMCQYDPTGVYNYLRTHQDNSYRLERVLPICEQYEVLDAVVWILERSGNSSRALDKVLNVVRDRVGAIAQTLENSEYGASGERIWSAEERAELHASLIKMRGMLKVATELCVNRSRRAAMTIQAVANKSREPTAGKSAGHTDAQKEAEDLWLRLLDTFAEARRKVITAIEKGSSRYSTDDELTNHIISSLKSFVQLIMDALLLSGPSLQVSLSRLLASLVQSQAHDNTATIGDLRDILMGMLDAYRYDGNLLAMTNRLFDNDLFLGVEGVVKSRGRGWRPRRSACDICGAAFWDTAARTAATTPQQRASGSNANTDEQLPDQGAECPESSQASTSAGIASHDHDVIIFRCSHSYHRKCLELQAPGVIRDSGENPYLCWICDTPPSTVRQEYQSRAASQQEAESVPSLNHKGKGRAI
ncbi:uncharacterized protein VTP21DRAFT_464 [Calcarisporiella thermophila]|uniref:uncharacterized protein n=1 Tax=Calcarisporiella thermophila TaxID=911321 RepID=UPI00374471CE